MQHIIIAGFGPTGRAAADALTVRRARLTIIDSNEHTAARPERPGRTCILGDATDLGTLSAAGAATADAIIITIPDVPSALRVCAAARELAPHALIAVRVTHQSEAALAREHGADEVIIAELETALAMAKRLTRALALQPCDLREGAD